jgi:DNA/RNA endonuclease G (NUC1)
MAFDLTGEGKLPTNQQGAVLKYDTATGYWVPVNKIGRNLLNPTAPNYLTQLTSYLNNYRDKPLILIGDWSGSNYINAGFAEGAADAMFTALVRLDQLRGGSIGNAGGIYDLQGKLIRTQGEIFRSPFHFIGHGHGAVVNSEIVQRLGTYYPLAGGTTQENRSLQVTTLDPYVFDSTATGSGFQTIPEPIVKTWSNVTYADNYYQTFRGITVPGIPTSNPNRYLLDADLNVDLSRKAEFNLYGHYAALTWYMGTDNLSTGADNFRRLGDLDLVGISDPTKTWYYPNHTEANFGASNITQAPWEGIGTGWFYADGGGGVELRPFGVSGLDKQTISSQFGSFNNYLAQTRTAVGFDNTATLFQRGDYAVPTLFNGNFDMKGQPVTPTNIISGWSLSGTGSLIKRNNSGNYSLELTNNSTITHDSFVVPDWGVLRFDLATENISSGHVEVKLEVEGNPLDDITQNIELLPANGSYEFGYNNNDTYRIGIGSQAFETFQISVPNSLHGKVAKLSFKLLDNTTVFLDNVFFKSEVFSFATPTINGLQARTDNQNYNTSYIKNNYLVERPQYTLSYNDNFKDPNWVAYKLDKKSLGILSRPTAPWTETPDRSVFQDQFDYPWKLDTLLPIGMITTNSMDYRRSGYDKGHMVANSNFNRIKKDQFSTFTTSAMLPQHPDNNRIVKDVNGSVIYKAAWTAFEEYLTNDVSNSGPNYKSYYIFSGGIFNPSNGSKITNEEIINSKNIEIPEFTWKIAVNSQNQSDIKAIITPNTARPSQGQYPFTQYLPGGGQKVINSPGEWQDWRTWLVSYQDIENWTRINFNLSV